jgi:hypothetical protein
MSYNLDSSNTYLWNTGNCGIGGAAALTVHVRGRLATLADDSAKYLFSNWNDNNGNLIMRVDTSPDLCRFYIQTSVTWYGGNVNHPITDLDWHSFALVWDGSELSGWLDGAKGSITFSTSGTFGTSGNNTLIGARDNNSDGAGFDAWNGDLAETALYTAALTEGELLGLSAGYSPELIRPSSLVAYWQLLGNLSPETDRIGGYDMTLENSPAPADHPPVIYRIPQFQPLLPSSFPQTVIVNELTLAGSAETGAASTTQGSWQISRPIGRISGVFFPVRVIGGTAGPQTVVLDQLTLAGSAVTATAVPGAVTVVVDQLTLAGSAVTLTDVVPGAVTVVVDQLTLASSAVTATVVPGAVIVIVDQLTLASSAVTMTLVAVTTIVDQLTLAGSAIALTVIPGAVIVIVDQLTLASSAITATVILDLVVAVDQLTLASAAITMTLVAVTTIHR